MIENAKNGKWQNIQYFTENGLHSHESPEACKRNISGCILGGFVKLPDDGLVNRRQDSERFFHIKEGVGREKGRVVQGRGWGREG